MPIKNLLFIINIKNFTFYKIESNNYYCYFYSYNNFYYFDYCNKNKASNSLIIVTKTIIVIIAIFLRWLKRPVCNYIA